jgi:uracil-DNA glycosylase
MPAKALAPDARPFVPQGADLAELWAAAQKCHGCDLYRHATQAVLGEGPPSARSATAARAVIGPKHRLLEDRGQFFDHPWSASVTATVHPSAVLRSPDPEQRHTNYYAFVNDLIAVRKRLNGVAKAH